MSEPVVEADRRTFLGGPFGITILFVLLTTLMTWPQALVLRDHAIDHQDVYFNMWRLRWIAHALSTAPFELFNANIFYPERGVLAYSDAMLVEGVFAAPLFWAGVPPVLVHNFMLLGPIVASAVGIFVLSRHLTGSRAGAVMAGIVFAFAPYRFEHYMHMELQWTVWMPWALWALQRTIETGSPRFGLLMGLFLALQMASSVYYGVFLLILVAVAGLVQLLPLRGHHLARTVRALLLGGALATSVSWVYSLPYSSASSLVGTRSSHEVKTFSARPRDYLVATPENLLYGGSQPETPERRLFPGIVPPVLALLGLVLVRPTTVVIAYWAGLVVAFELSLGANGVVYPLLYEHVAMMRGLRAAARASALFLMFLGVLAAYGTAAFTRAMPKRLGPPVAALLCALVLLEYRVAPLALVPYPNEAPPLHRLLVALPRGTVIEFPVPGPAAPPHLDPRYAYMSTFHWMPLLNGYSGFFPPSYLRRLARLEDFPEGDSVPSLRREQVKYVIVHDDGYPMGKRARIVERLSELGLVPLRDLYDGWGTATIMELK